MAARWSWSQIGRLFIVLFGSFHMNTDYSSIAMKVIVSKNYKTVYVRTTTAKPRPVIANFHNYTASNVTVPAGSTAYLHCNASHVTKNQLLWVRQRDFRILTSGLIKYTPDDRFRLIRKTHSDVWTLQIKFVQKYDEGAYECQVSTRSGSMFYIINLRVVVPQAVLTPNENVHIDKGSPLMVICTIQNSHKNIRNLLWYHNDTVMNYDATRGVEIHTDYSDEVMSTLIINQSNLSDTGNYTCTAPYVTSASLHLFVSIGNKMAAIKEWNQGTESFRSSVYLTLITSLVMGIYY